MNTALDRTALYAALETAQAAETTAKQAIDDAFVALSKSGWGKIERVTWDHEYESDDQGGSYLSTNSLALVIDGESYCIGYNFDDMSTDNLDIEDDSPLRLLMTKYELAGEHDETEAMKHGLAELAELSFEEFENFLGLADGLVSRDKEAGEIDFT